MKIGGVLVNRNQANRVLPNLMYHLNGLGFDKIVFVDNDSFDRSVQWVEKLQDPRIKIMQTGPCGFVHMTYANEGLKWLIEQEGCDWVFPIDCDTIWSAVDADDNIVDFKTALAESNLYSFCAPNHGFAPQRSVIDRMAANPIFRQECLGHWWRYHTFRSTYYYCLKLVIHRREYETVPARWDEGNHPPNHQPHPSWPLLKNIRIYEMAAMDHDDLVRKTVNNSVGLIGAHGYAWARFGVGDHIRKFLHELMVRGNLNEFFNGTILDDLKVQLSDKGLTSDGRIKYYTQLSNLQYDEPEIVRQLLSQLPEIEDVKTLQKMGEKPQPMLSETMRLRNALT